MWQGGICLQSKPFEIDLGGVKCRTQGFLKGPFLASRGRWWRNSASWKNFPKNTLKISRGAMHAVCVNVRERERWTADEQCHRPVSKVSCVIVHLLTRDCRHKVSRSPRLYVNYVLQETCTHREWPAMLHTDVLCVASQFSWMLLPCIRSSTVTSRGRYHSWHGVYHGCARRHQGVRSQCMPTEIHLNYTTVCDKDRHAVATQ